MSTVVIRVVCSDIKASIVRHFIILLSVILALTSCASYEVTDNKPVTPERKNNDYRQQQPLLNVGINLFNVKLRKKSEVNFEALRNSESIWYARQLKDALDYSNVWGSVWVLPRNYNQAIDLMIAATILQSDGERLIVQVRATDATGRQWLDKQYSHKVNAYTYDPNVANAVIDEDPFQNLFNQIANDLLLLRLELVSSDALAISDVSDIRFAFDLSPQHFKDYIAIRKSRGNKNSRSARNNHEYILLGLPALNDPNYIAIQRITVRNELFLDIIQDYYRLFADNIDEPYQNWRSSSYSDVVQERRLKQQALREKIGGIVSVGAGVLASASIDSNDSQSTKEAKRATASAAIGAGAALIRSGFQKSEEASHYREVIIELAESIDADLEPTVLEVDDKTITLNGTMQQQFDAWRDLLLESYLIETGKGLNTTDPNSI